MREWDMHYPRWRALGNERMGHALSKMAGTGERENGTCNIQDGGHWGTREIENGMYISLSC